MKNQKKLKYITNFLLVIIVSYSILNTFSHAETVPITSGRFSIMVNDIESKLPYVSNHPINIQDTAIETLIISIHSSSPIAQTYLESAQIATNYAQNTEDNTLIIAPQFFQDNQFEEPIPPTLLYWDQYPFWGSQRALRGPDRQSLNISTFSVLDKLLETITRSNFFPNIRRVIVLGHSAGGQMVQRYAASNIFESNYAIQRCIKMKYLVMAPSSYVYLNNERIEENSSNVFEIPTGSYLNDCYAFNSYGYGLNNLYSYHDELGLSSEVIRLQYKERNVLYLVGSEDNNPDDPFLSTTCYSMLQGTNRLERAQIYFEYLKYYYGTQITNKHMFKIVQNVGHWGRGLITSEEGVAFIFSEDTTSSNNINIVPIISLLLLD